MQQHSSRPQLRCSSSTAAAIASTSLHFKPKMAHFKLNNTDWQFPILFENHITVSYAVFKTIYNGHQADRPATNSSITDSSAERLWAIESMPHSRTSRMTVWHAIERSSPSESTFSWVLALILTQSGCKLSMSHRLLLHRRGFSSLAPCWHTGVCALYRRYTSEQLHVGCWPRRPACCLVDQCLSVSLLDLVVQCTA